MSWREEGVVDEVSMTARMSTALRMSMNCFPLSLRLAFYKFVAATIQIPAIQSARFAFSTPGLVDCPRVDNLRRQASIVGRADLVIYYV